MKRHDLFINGEWTKAKTDEYIQVENPATKEIIAEVPACKDEDVNIAVEGAKKALHDWKNTDIKVRADYVEKMNEYFKANADEIADGIIDELGSVISVTKDWHVTSYFEHIEYYLDLARNMDLVDHYDDYDVVKEPVGVIAALTPWNFPFGQIIKKVLPALLMGNTVVLKPSQSAPLASYYFAQAAIEVGLPAGVLQLVTGRGGEVGNVLATHKDVNMVSFTGSTEGGKEVSKLGLDSIKRLQLELGGKSPALILEGADYEKAIKHALEQVYPNTGQACTSKTRIIAPRKDKEVIDKIVYDVSASYKYGDPRDEESQFGPLINENAYEKVMKYIELGKEEADLLFEGEYLDLPGYYVPPVAFTNVDNKSRIAQEEIFGPVVAIIYYDTVEEGIELSNETIYGLHAQIYGPEDKALEIASMIDAGAVKINYVSTTHNAPFGGFKQSGLGREGGKYGLEEYVELKTIFK